MKKVSFIFLFMLLVASLQAQTSKSVNISAGGLKASMTDSELSSVTDLKVTGTIDARDFKTMRDLMPKLSVVDLGSVSIAYYKGDEGTYNYGSAEYAANAIPQEAFYNKQTLTKVIALPQVTEISYRSFCCCYYLTSIMLPSSLKIIREEAFDHCLFLPDISLPSGLNQILKMAFASCNSLKSLDIGPNVGIQVRAFQDSYIDLKIDPANPYYVYSEGILYDKKQTEIGYCNGNKRGKYIVPSTVKTIKEGAFLWNGLSSILVQEGTTTIETIAFNADAGSLECVFYPKSVTTLQSDFNNCKHLKAFCTYANTPVVAPDGMFKYTDVNKCVLYVPKGSSSAYKAANIWGSFKNIVEGDGFWISGVKDTISGQATSSTHIKSYSNAKLNTKSNQSWLTVSPAQTSLGDELLTFTATENSTIAPRKGIVTISLPGGSSQTIEVVQAKGPEKLSVSTSSISLDYLSNSVGSVTVTSNASWTVISDQSWVVPVGGKDFQGNVTLYVSAESNRNTSSRTATVTIKTAGGLTQTIKVTQKAFPLYLSVDNLGFTVKSEGYKYITPVLSNVVWTAKSNSSWLSTSKTSGTNTSGNLSSETIVVTVAANPTTTQRNGSITFSATGVADQTLTFVQEAAAPSVTLSANKLSIGAAENSKQTLGIKANTDWAVSNPATWLRVSKTSGTGDESLTFTASANSSTTKRRAILTLTSSKVSSQTFTLEQDAAAAFVNVSTDKLTFEGSTNLTKTFTMSTNTTWSISQTATWFTVKSTGTSGDVSFTVTATPNTSEKTREAVITINATGGIIKTLMVSQTGVTGIADITVDKLAFYPNPVKDILHLKPELLQCKLSIYSMSGIMLLDKIITDTEIDLSSLQTGTYTIIVSDKNAAKKALLIKE